MIYGEKMLDVKKLTGHELYIIKEGLGDKYYHDPMLSEIYNKMKEEVDNEWMERCLSL